MQVLNLIRDKNTTVFNWFPIEGIGKRYLWCKNYDRCLNKAVANNWDSFNCNGCEYENRGTLLFDVELFIKNDLKKDGLEMIDLPLYFSHMTFLQEATEITTTHDDQKERGGSDKYQFTINDLRSAIMAMAK